MPALATRAADTRVRTAGLFNSLSDPTRIQVLQLFERRQPDELSAKLIAAEIGVPLSNVSYHVKLLREAGFVRQTRAEPRRGALERYHELTPAGYDALGLVDHAESL